MSRAAWAASTVAALGLFLVSWSLLHHGTFARDQITDTGLYETYGDAMARGHVPYRDFRLEYPPGALPVFVLPSLGHEGNRDTYDRWFDRLMALCGCIAIVGAALVLRAVGAGVARTTAALGLIAISPLLMGSVVLSRFDLLAGGSRGARPRGAAARAARARCSRSRCGDRGEAVAGSARAARSSRTSGGRAARAQPSRG